MTDSMRLSAIVEAAVAHRSIGQERLGFAAEARSASSLDGLGGMLDWNVIGALLGSIYSNSKGEAAWPPLAMFKHVLSLSKGPCFCRSGMTCRT